MKPGRVIGWLVLLLLAATCQPSAAVSGVVRDEHGPLAWAVVRLKTTELSTTTDASGRFNLRGLPPGQPFTLTAWAPGYFIGGGEEMPAGTDEIELVLERIADRDHPEYAWRAALAENAPEGEQPCARCHSRAGTGLPFDLPLDEWRLDAHAGSAVNPRFLSMYLGQDLSGKQSPPRRYSYNRDYGRLPLRPSASEPYYGPGYRLDFPDTAGNCAACHAPLAAVDDPYGINPSRVTGVEVEGVSCDFCHKVWEVRLDPSSGLPLAHMPGVLSFELRRPPEGEQFFAGPFDDVAPGEDTYSPLQLQSEFCAPCHFGVFWDTLVYNSFGEWLDSPYSHPQTGRTCQDCHMPSSGATHFAHPAEGGEQRDPALIASHRMPGSSDESLLQNALTMDVQTLRQGGEIIVKVTLVNDQTGHHVPTDSPLRHMILLVSVMDGEGRELPLLSGPRVPEWGGAGDPAEGNYAGLPGTAYAKVLQELWTEVAPTGAYWNPTVVLSDNRLPALGRDKTVYTFSAPQGEELVVDVRLLFRRAYMELMRQKGWDMPDILMESQRLQVGP